ncbi:MAG TPA: hypothetical protein VFB52_04275 [Solirubrobacterales bacterium]|nr:hypothetical protein [Solirubrobacterales bacterium]
MSVVRRKPLACLAAVVACLFVVGSVAAAEKVAIEGDPHVVSEQSLKDELMKTGVAIQFHTVESGEVPSVVGVARDGGAVVGFEFQLYPSSDEATAWDLGELPAAAFGWPPKYKDFLLKVEVRGVLGNVAFAEYERGVLESQSTVKEVNERQRSKQRVARALDDALFGLFPSSDPYVHALATVPG